MIKNIIFDLGGVLLDFKPEVYLKSIGLSNEEAKLFVKLIWGSSEWSKSDRGQISYEKIIDGVSSNNPKYADKLRYALENKDNSLILSENFEACEYFKELKLKGFKLYFLSNVNPYDLKYDKENFEIFKLIDGGVYSSEIGYIKPEKECYEELLNKYNLIPEESIFIDDILENVEASKNLNIHSVHFKTLEQVKLDVEKIIKMNSKEFSKLTN